MTALLSIPDLCAAIDAGDDPALPILADALEEAGDAPAQGLRGIMLTKPYYWREDGTAWWAWHQFSPQLWAKLKAVGAHTRHAGFHEGDDGALYYPTRSAAFLALAAALI